MLPAVSDELHRQLITDLLIESFEGLERFDRELLALEKGARNEETLNIIFRVIHTIKGTAGCIGLGRIEATAHVGESLLSLLRDGKIQSSAELISALLALSDALRGILRHLENHGTEGTTDHTALIDRLQALQTPGAAPASAAPAAPSAPAGFGLFDDDAPVPAPAAPAPAAPAAYGLFEEAPAAAPRAAAEAEPSGRASVSESAIRVEVTQLDKLMNLVGELVLARNQIIQNVAQPDAAALHAASQRLNLITTELQGSVMKTRMQPIGNVWAKFPRIVRDVSQELGKKINLVMEGQETELDRTIIEAIKDPLTHIVRNAIDHGLEVPAARLAAGKTEEGRLLLRAFHEGGQVNIEFTDDGQGINVPRVKAKAIERGLITVDQAARLSDREVFNLIFLPGFSTAEKVTNLSGRGVGMDVVKTNIEKIGGSVDVQSAAGRGTTLKIKIPLTLAIIPALIVTSGGERFAIPQVNLLELVRLEGEDAQRKIETLYNAPVYRLRGKLLPLVDLNRHLRLKTKTGDEAVSIVVLQADGRQFGLVVDVINDAEEIVVKPLGKQLKSLACFAGATIMGDGRVALILDVLGVAHQARVVTEVRDRALADDSQGENQRDDRQTLLLFESRRGRHLALPLSMVARLEELPVASIERSGRREVVQYRGQIMPLIRVADYIGDEADADTTGELPDFMQVVVYSEHGRSVGLVVSTISDIVHEALTAQRAATREGILGSAVIQHRVTDLLDVEGIIRAADPAFYETSAT
ncbi:chemotaxis protein CheW [Horticoccus sp. 23ND18S-11]|uniref:chemotaxis protein CheW n=1 Tax=Horticoccus sp. 23ND18S-11 TaxID=3391832 RepID=UPI0039C908D4